MLYQKFLLFITNVSLLYSLTALQIFRFGFFNFILDNILDFCNSDVVHEIELKSGPNKTVEPAILTLSKYNTMLSKKTCLIRFSMPTSHWYADYGLILGIDYISIKSNTNKTCDDFLIVSGSDVSSQLKWCENKTDTIGKSFKEGKFLDILFHSGEDSESKFQLVITPFKGLKNLEFFSNNYLYLLNVENRTDSFIPIRILLLQYKSTQMQR